MNSRANSKKRRTWGIIIPAQVEFFVRATAGSVAEAKRVAIRAKDDGEMIVTNTGRPRIDTGFTGCGAKGFARS